MKNFSRILFSLFLLPGSVFFAAEVKAAAKNNRIKPVVKNKVLTATTYFIHPVSGSDDNAGTSKQAAFKTLDPISKIQLHPGDRIVLADGQVYEGSLRLVNQQGTAEAPIRIYSDKWGTGDVGVSAQINFKSRANGILIENSSFVEVSHLRLTGNGYTAPGEPSDMRCAVLVRNTDQPDMKGIRMDHLQIKDVYYENPGFIREKNEVRSANGTQRYGWGIRVINQKANQLLSKVLIEDCSVEDVSHTGIKLTGSKKNMYDIKLLRNKVKNTGGPGIQMSEVQDVYVAGNVVDHSGSTSDSRKWGRGSGLWTWGSSNVLIEKNQFLYANGPGDSDGAHIDFNCDNIIIQYNLSAYNAGGFCEILGNNYNCVYRYNISVNDGYRIKGKDGAFQEGKTLWLSGYQGDKQKRKGPVNTYIYNNTIYADASINPKLAFDNTSRDVLIANNIFCIAHPFQMVLGDQNKPDEHTGKPIENMRVLNNLFMNSSHWPAEMVLTEQVSVFGDPAFKKPGGLQLADYIPANSALVRNKGVSIQLKQSVEAVASKLGQVNRDIMNNPLPAVPSIGAIEPGVAGSSF